MDPSPGCGLGKAAPAPAGTSALEVGADVVTEAPLGMTTVDTWPPAPATAPWMSASLGLLL